MKKYLSLLFVSMMALLGYQANAAMYLIGDMNNWNPEAPTEMSLVTGSTSEYTVEVELTATTYFSFATKVSTNGWNGLTADDRWVSGQDVEVVLDQEMQAQHGTNGAFRITNANGTYIINITDDGKVKVSLKQSAPEPDPAFYIAGTFTSWATNKVEMTPDATGNIFSVTIEGVENNAEFKFIDEHTNWYGGANSPVVSKDNCENIGILQGAGDNFKISLEETANLTFTINKSAATMTVTGWPVPVVEPAKVYIIGSFNNWDQDSKVEMTAVPTAEGLYTITKELEAGATFKFMEGDEWIGAVADGNQFEVTEEQVTTPLSLTKENGGKDFMIPVAGEWTMTVNLNDMNVVIEGEWVVPVEELHVYAIQNDAEGNWNLSTGTELALDESGANPHYIGVVTLVAVSEANGAPMRAEGEGKAYVGFTTKLGESWEDIAEGRFGPVSNGNFVMEDQYFDQPIEITPVGQGDKFIEIKPGKYQLDVDLENNVLKVTDLNPTGIEDMNAVKAVARVKYVNMAGVQADEAFDGVNVKVITYSDGTTKAVKVIK